jgi:hypothetical protein
VDGDDNCERCNGKDAKERGGLFEGNYPVLAFQSAYSSLVLHKSHLKISKSCAELILMFVSKSLFFFGANLFYFKRLIVFRLIELFNVKVLS